MSKKILNAGAWEQEIASLRGRLLEIKEIIEAVDNRAMACDGPVPSTLQEMTQKEISKIYKLASGR